MQPKTHIRAGTEEVVRRERRLWVCFLFCVLKDPKLFAMGVIGGGSKYLTGFKETDKDVCIVLPFLGFISRVVVAAAAFTLVFLMGGWVLQEEDGKTISVHATDGEKTAGFGQDSEALAREENQRAERRLEASVNRKRGDSDNDPAKHPVDVVASFVQTFTEPEDIDVSEKLAKP